MPGRLLLAVLLVVLDLASSFPTILADGTRTYLPGAPSAGYDEAGYSGLVDQHGSLLGTVSDSGVVPALRTYDPYGAARPGSADPAGVGFTGEWRNGTGLVHLRARDYDPVLARFISRDSFGGLAMAPQTANRYAFGAGNPLTAADPSGHFNNHLIMPVRSFVSLGVSALGPVGLGYVTLTGILGYDPIAGVSLSPEERALYLAPAGIGAIAVIAAKLAPRLVAATLGRADDALAFGRAMGSRFAGAARSAVTRAGESLSAFGSRVGRAIDRAGDALGAAWASRGRILGNEFGHIRLGAPTKAGLPKATVGWASSVDYRATFAAANAGVRDVWVHHAVPQSVLYRYPGLFKPEEIHSLQNLRGIPVGAVNREIHLGEISRLWNEFFRGHASPTRDEVLDFATEVDRKLGIFFDPPVQ